MLGELLDDIDFDGAYTSDLKRTQQTLAGILKGKKAPISADDASILHNAALNERDYGRLTGKNKWEVKDEIGDEAFTGIRRGWDYPVPGGETLKDVHGRVVPFFDEEILPRLQAGENILLVAHGNSIRALMKHLEDIDEQDMAEVEMPEEDTEPPPLPPCLAGHLLGIAPAGDQRFTSKRIADQAHAERLLADILRKGRVD